MILNTPRVIVFGSDHAGFSLKESLKLYVQKKYPGINIVDVGTSSKDSVDYPKYGQAAARKVKKTSGSVGVIVCGTGIGISISANRVKGIRAAVCHDVATARISRQHNNANVLALGGKKVSCSGASRLLSVFLSTPFDGGRHSRRIKQLDRGI